MTDPGNDKAAERPDAAEHDAFNQGVSSQEPAEGADDVPSGGIDSPGA